MMSLRIARQWSFVTLLVVLVVMGSALFWGGPKVALWLARHGVAPKVAYPSDVRGFDQSDAMMCWVDRAHQIHCQSKTHLPISTPPDDGIRWRSLVVHQRGACAIDEFVVRCWGDVPAVPDVVDGTSVRYLFVWDGQFCALKDYGPVCWSKTQRAWSPLPKGTRYRAVRAGGARLCGLRDSDDVPIVCVEDHQLTTINPNQHPIKQVAVGRAHTCARLEARGQNVRCWGSSWFGKLDVPNESFKSIVASDEATCGLTRLNKIVCWGKDMHGAVDLNLNAYWHVAVVGKQFCRFGDGPTVCWPD